MGEMRFILAFSFLVIHGVCAQGHRVFFYIFWELKEKKKKLYFKIEKKLRGSFYTAVWYKKYIKKHTNTHTNNTRLKKTKNPLITLLLLLNHPPSKPNPQKRHQKTRNLITLSQLQRSLSIIVFNTGLDLGV